MGKNTAIEWTDHTYNPWWGCVKVSPGCANCYAETLDARYHPGDAHWGKNAPRRFFNDKHWNEPKLWNKVAEAAGKRARVFCGSMCDIFENRPDLVEPRARLFQLILDTPNLEWLLLTKRIEEVKNLVPESWLTAGFPGNVRLGTTVETQEYAWRLEILTSFNVPNFVSIEPILGEVDISWFLNGCPEQTRQREYVTRDMAIDAGDRSLEGTIYSDEEWEQTCHPIDWVIVGGESGVKARPCHPDWARSLRDQCLDANVPYFWKQWGEWIPLTGGMDSAYTPGKRIEYIGIDGKFKDTNSLPHFNKPDDWVLVQNVGKKAAGSLLDGVAWKQFPKEAE